MFYQIQRASQNMPTERSISHLFPCAHYPQKVVLWKVSSSLLWSLVLRCCWKHCLRVISSIILKGIFPARTLDLQINLNTFWTKYKMKIPIVFLLILFPSLKYFTFPTKNPKTSHQEYLYLLCEYFTQSEQFYLICILYSLLPQNR